MFFCFCFFFKKLIFFFVFLFCLLLKISVSNANTRHCCYLHSGNNISNTCEECVYKHVPVIFSVHPFESRGFVILSYCKPSEEMSSGRFPKCDVRCGEHVSCFGKVHSASSPPSLHLFLKKQNKTNYVFFFGFCAMTCRFLHL